MGAMTEAELLKIKGLLDCLKLKCKTDPLYTNTVAGLAIINRELRLKEIERDPTGKHERVSEATVRESQTEANHLHRVDAKDTRV